MVSSETQSLKQMSALMARISMVIIAAVPVIFALVWLDVIAVRNVMGVEAANDFIASPQTSSARRLGGFALSMIPQIALLYGVWHLKLMFSGFAAGAFFGPSSAGHLKHFARGLLGFALLDFIIELPLSAYVVWELPPGTRKATLSLGWNDFQILLLSLLFFALTRIMAEGMRLARENEEFV